MVSYQCEWIQGTMIYNIGNHFLLFGPFRSYKLKKKKKNPGFGIYAKISGKTTGLREKKLLGKNLTYILI